MKGFTHSWTSVAVGMLVTAEVGYHVALNAGPEMQNIFDASTGFMISLPFLGAYFGGMYPDVDAPGNTTVSRGFFDVSHIFPHRWVLHTPLYGLITTIPFIILALFIPQFRYVPIAVFVGYLWHLFLDSWTYEGIMWFYPFSRRHFHIRILCPVYTFLCDIYTQFLTEVVLTAVLFVVILYFAGVRTAACYEIIYAKQLWPDIIK